MDNEYIEKVRSNLGGVLSRIRDASGGREVKLLLATKTVPPEVINYVSENFGISLIGENKVQELLEKYGELDTEHLHIHFIGYLQTNKVKQIIDKVEMIHSVDRLSLAQEISKRARAIGKKMPILVEINIAKEEQKSGVMPDDAEEFIKSIVSLEGIAIKGLMTMAPARISSEQYKEYFRETKELLERIKALDIEGVEMETLSMGMSESYTEGVECGATVVRVGSAIFGKRAYPEKNTEEREGLNDADFQQ